MSTIYEKDEDLLKLAEKVIENESRLEYIDLDKIAFVKLVFFNSASKRFALLRLAP